MERFLNERNEMREQKKLQEDSLALKEKELQALQRMLPAQSKVKQTQITSHRLHTDKWKRKLGKEVLADGFKPSFTQKV